MIIARSSHEAREVIDRMVGELSPNAIEAVASVFAAAGTTPVRTAFAARGMRVIARLLELSDDRALANATGATSDYAALLQLLAQAPITDELGKPTEHDPLIQERIAGLVAREDLLHAEGGVVSGEQIASLLGLSRQAVDHRRRKGTLLALTLGRRGYAYPIWQVVEGRTIEGLDTVLAQLRGFDPWTQLAFMLNPNTWLDDESPLNALRRGQIERVRDAASVYGEQVAA